MGRRIGYCSLVVVILVTGCNTTNNLTAKKPTQGTNLADAKGSSSTSYVGSPEFSSSQKLQDPVKIHLAYANWNEQSGNYQEAHNSYLKVLEKSPKNAEAMIGLSRIDRVHGREAEADARLKKALKLHPKDPQVLVAVGQVHASRNEWPEAVVKMKAAHDLAPFDKVYDYHLAVVLARSGEIHASQEHFTRAVGLAEANFNIGYILKEQGQTAEAERYLKMALKQKPELKQAESALAAIRMPDTEEVQPASFNEKVRF